jgi:hypothetical protein
MILCLNISYDRLDVRINVSDVAADGTVLVQPQLIRCDALRHLDGILTATVTHHGCHSMGVDNNLSGGAQVKMGVVDRTVPQLTETHG